MMDDFEDFGKLYDREFRKHIVSYVQQMMERDLPYYLCMYAEDGAIAFELKGEKIFRDIRFGGYDSNITGNVYNTEEIQGQRDFIEGFILGTVEKHGGVNIVNASDFEKMWARARQYAKKHKCKNAKSRSYMKMNTKSGCVWAVVIVVYLFLVMISVFHVPMSLFLRMLPPIVAVVLLSKGKPIWVKSVVAGLLVLTAVYTLFYNDILGPMEFMIRDMPIDMPAQFYHSWRYYWAVCYLYEMFWRWGVPSVIFLLGYTIWIKWFS